MRAEDAPPAGWYPDPEGAARLRWWDGTDWSGHFRPRPSQYELEMYAATLDHQRQATARSTATPAAVRTSVGADTREAVEQVRQVARSEADRASEMVAEQLRAARRELQPLITSYTSKLRRWLRIAIAIGVVLVVAWIVWQVFIQVSLLEWIGDRIDAVTSGDE